MLAAMFSGRHPVSKDKDGRFFIDADGEIFYYILNFLRFERLPSADLSLLVYEQARYLDLQTMVNCLESFSPVKQEKYLEEIRSLYPYYRKLLDKIDGALNNKKFNCYKMQANIPLSMISETTETQICDDCRQLVEKTAADDPQGQALLFLIRHELEKRNFELTSNIGTCGKWICDINGDISGGCCVIKIAFEIQNKKQ